MAVITNSQVGTRGNDFISLARPLEIINRPSGPTVFIWAGDGDDTIALPPGFEIDFSRPFATTPDVFIYGDQAPQSPVNNGKADGSGHGRDQIHLGENWWGVGGLKADIFMLHGGGYAEDRAASVRDFHPGEGDKLIVAHDERLPVEVDEFRFINIRADNDRAGGMVGILVRAELWFDSPSNPITDGQGVDLRLNDLGNFRADHLSGERLEWGGRGEPATKLAAIEQWVEDGFGDWLLVG